MSADLPVSTPSACAFALLLLTSGAHSVLADDAPLLDASEPAAAPGVYIPDGATDFFSVIVRGKREVGYAAIRASTGTKTDTPLLKTPLSVQVVTQQVLQDQQSIQIADAIRNVSGVTAGFTNGGFSEEFVIRGFNTGFSNYVDGFRFRATRIPSVLAERIEVVKGAAANLFGRIEPGGLVNVVLKRPQVQSQVTLEQQFGGDDLMRSSLDATGSLTADDTLQYRLIAEYLDSGSFRDTVETQRFLVSPSLRWNIGEQTRLDVHYFYFDEDSVDDATGIPALGNRPAKIPRSRFLGEPTLDRANTRISQGSVGFERAFGSTWTLRGQVIRQTREVVDNATSGFFLDESSGDLVRGYFGARTTGTPTYFGDFNLLGSFRTGVIQHELLVGVDYLDNEVLVRALSLPAAAINIFNPVFGRSGVDVRQPDNRFFADRVDAVGFYVQDQVSVGERLHVLLGGRYDDASFESGVARGAGQSLAAAAANSDEVDNTRFSPRAGVLYQLGANLSLYANYSESLGSANAGRERSGARIEPEFGKQQELGLKAQSNDRRFTASLALYNLTKQNVSTPIPGTEFSQAIGEARSRGVEVDLAGQLTTHLTLIAAYAYTDAEVRAGDSAGNRLFNVPRQSASVWAKYDRQPDATRSWSVGGGIYALSQRQGDNANTFQLPGFARTDAMFQYRWPLGELRAAFQVNVENLFDTKYFLSSGGFNTNITPGLPRRVIGSVRVDF